MWMGVAGSAALWSCLICAFLTMGAYGLALARPADNRFKLAGRVFYALTAAGILAAFGFLIAIVYSKTVGGVYRYDYAWSHTSNDLKGFYRLAATWSGQEGSFLLWGFWTAIIGFLVFAKAGRYEARVMPFFVTVLAFLAGILIKQSPFTLLTGLTASQMAELHGMSQFPLEGQGLNPSLQNYWMTIHPPTIFFGFASLAVPYCYAIAALIWKDYEDWTPRVMPYALLTCLTLGVGLFMGGYWAYETQGWHGFWGWDPVENASFFPWLAITALVHGLVVQRDRGGMAKTNTFLGLLGFWLFLLGTFLTRSGALAAKDPNDPNGGLLSVHAFDNISKSGLYLMVAMLVGYGVVALAMWLWRLPSMPGRKTTGDTLLSRDFAFFMAVLLMVIACTIVALGTTQPLFLSWMHKPPSKVEPVFYNRALFPLTVLASLLMGMVPWLAWRKTNSETFLKKMLVPWFLMLGFGFVMLFLVVGWQRDLDANAAANFALMQKPDPSWAEKSHAWISPAIQRMAVVTMASLGMLAALSNSMLAFRVFKSKKPLAAGGWLAHVGIGVMIVGIIVSNTFERTRRFTIHEGGDPTEVFGYKFQFEKTTGKIDPRFPTNPDFDKENAVSIRVTPPDGQTNSDGTRTFVVNPRWFVYNLNIFPPETSPDSRFERMRWPHIQKFMGHDLYVGFASDPVFKGWPVQAKKGVEQDFGPYKLMFANDQVQPGKMIRALVLLRTQDDGLLGAEPTIVMSPSSDGTDMDTSLKNIALRKVIQENGGFRFGDYYQKDGVPGVVMLNSINANTGVADLEVSMPDKHGAWVIPMEVTYKPWINLVWVGVIIMGIGVFLAMTRRALEARKVADGPITERAPKDESDAQKGANRTPDLLPAMSVAGSGASGSETAAPGKTGRSPAVKQRRTQPPSRA